MDTLIIHKRRKQFTAFVRKPLYSEEHVASSAQLWELVWRSSSHMFRRDFVEQRNKLPAVRRRPYLAP